MRGKQFLVRRTHLSLILIDIGYSLELTHQCSITGTVPFAFNPSFYLSFRSRYPHKSKRKFICGRCRPLGVVHLARRHRATPTLQRIFIHTRLTDLICRKACPCSSLIECLSRTLSQCHHRSSLDGCNPLQPRPLMKRRSRTHRQAPGAYPAPSACWIFWLLLWSS